MPYSDKQCQPPSAADTARATDFKISSWQAVDLAPLDQIKGELAKGNPVVIGFDDRPAFSALRGDAVYHSSMEPVVGGHAVTVVGYDEVRQAFKAINSWSQSWGNRGYGWFGYDAFAKDVREAYVMRPADGVKPPPPAPPSPPPVPAPDAFSFVSCGLVSTVQTGKGLEVRGFVGTLLEQKEVREKAQQLKATAVDVAVRQWPQCEALMTLSRGLAASDRPRIKVFRPTADASLPAGSTFLIEIESPSTPSFLHVTYIQADGKAVNLVQPDLMALSPVQPHTKMTLGDGRNGGPKYTVAAPFGEEVVMAIASKAPLFAEKRPVTETEREFLTALRAAVMARPVASSPERLFAADYDSVITVSQKP
jgi:hypothetical protein